MKNALLTGLAMLWMVLGIFGTANSAVISLDSYTLQSQGGASGDSYWGWGKTDWNLALSLPPITSVSEIDDMLSNGYRYVHGEYANYDELNGIFSWNTGGTTEPIDTVLDYVFEGDLLLDSFGLQMTRSYSGDLIANVYRDGALVSTVIHELESLHWGPSNNATPTMLTYELGGIMADRVELEFLGHVGLHEVQFSAVPVPGAIWLLASGVIGLAGFRRKFKK